MGAASNKFSQQTDSIYFPDTYQFVGFHGTYTTVPKSLGYVSFWISGCPTIPDLDKNTTTDTNQTSSNQTDNQTVILNATETFQPTMTLSVNMIVGVSFASVFCVLVIALIICLAVRAKNKPTKALAHKADDDDGE